MMAIGSKLAVLTSTGGRPAGYSSAPCSLHILLAISIPHGAALATPGDEAPQLGAKMAQGLLKLNAIVLRL